MRPEDNIHIGTSGWNFDSWIGAFYDEGITDNNMLSAYAATFATAELNNSFYHLPEQKAVKSWRSNTPEDFIFSCKASRYITHMKKLKDPQESVKNLIEALKPFGKQLGPILFQLPPNWNVNTDRLEAFLEALPGKYRYVFEFRDKSWLCNEVFDLLKEHGAALCFYDLKGYHSPETPTTDFIYIRLHGPKAKAYAGSYDGRTLAGYAKKFLNWVEEEKEVFCYFDNDQKACAPTDAQKLIKSIERQA